MKLTPIILLVILGGVAVSACKKSKSKSEPVNLGYAGKMAGKHRWRSIEHEAVFDSSGDAVRDSNGNIVTVPHEVITFDSIIALTSTQIAFTSLKNLQGAFTIYDTLDFIGENKSEKTVMFYDYSSGKYYVTNDTLMYNYDKGTFVRHIKQNVHPAFNPGFDIYYYSP